MDELITNEIILKWETIGYTCIIDTGLIGLHPTFYLEANAQYLVGRVKAKLLSLPIDGNPVTITNPQEMKVSVPINLWHQFKLNHRDRWWMPFKNVRFKTKIYNVIASITIDPKIVFPLSKKKFPEYLGRPYFRISDKVKLESIGND